MDLLRFLHLKEAHERIHKIIAVVRKAIDEKIASIEKSYKFFVSIGRDKKEYALKYRLKDPNFHYVMELNKGRDVYDLAKSWVRDRTNKLMIARNWLQKRDPSLFFQEPDPENDDN